VGAAPSVMGNWARRCMKEKRGVVEVTRSKVCLSEIVWVEEDY
jgi:hypothetical protein